MAALALHADRGDDDSVGDFRAEQYFPLWVINIWGLDYVRRNMPSVQADLRGMPRTEALIRFCREASKQPFALNCHLYGLRRHKTDTNDTALIGIATRGLEMADLVGDGERIPIKSFMWHKIAKLSFDKRKVTIVGMDGVRIVLYAQSDDKARYLLEFCKSVHQQIMALQADINEARNLEMKGIKIDTFSIFIIFQRGERLTSHTYTAKVMCSIQWTVSIRFRVDRVNDAVSYRTRQVIQHRALSAIVNTITMTAMRNVVRQSNHFTLCIDINFRCRHGFESDCIRVVT
jgi:hypothetical protein